MFKDKGMIHDTLSALAEQLAAKKSHKVDLLICGGAALNLLNLVGRTTVDVDVLAFVIEKRGAQPTLQLAKPFPSYLEEAVKKVARDFRIPETWMNSGPTIALELGLPEGLLGRAETRSYGVHLTVRLMSRYDQIHFKLYAATDTGGKHFEDLLQLKPTAKELAEAARWSLTQDVSEPFKDQLKKMLVHMGYSDVADRI